MSDQTIKIKRGTQAQVESATLQIGEAAFATDTKALYLGDGVGKNYIGKVLSDTFANRPTAGVSGRMFYATDTDDLYLDNGSSWILVGGPTPSYYKETISTASTTWTINHNLGTSDVIVDIYESNKKVIPDEVEITSDNQIVVTFTSATSGKINIVGLV